MNGSIVIIAAICCLFKECYFGWNAMPQSDAEMIADILWAILFALAFVGN